MDTATRSRVILLLETRRYNPEQLRVPKGFEGGGRFRGLATQLVALLKDWKKGDGPDDPIGEHLKSLDPATRREKLRNAITDMRKKRLAAGDHEGAARLVPRRGASEDELKVLLYKDAKGGGVEAPAAKAPAKVAKKATPRKSTPFGAGIQKAVDAGLTDTPVERLGREEAAKKATPRKAAPPFDARQASRRLGSASTREEANAALDGLTKPQLLEVARESGMTSVSTSLSRDAMKHRMIELAGAGRYDTQTAYLANMEAEGGLATLAPRTPGGVAPIRPKQDFSVAQGTQEKLVQTYGKHPDFDATGRSVNAAKARQQLLATDSNDDRRAYLQSLGMSNTQAAALAKALGSRQSREGADANIDLIVKHFDTTSVTSHTGSTGYAPSLADAPDLTGLTTRQKRARLKAMGFTPEQVDELAPTAAMVKKAAAVSGPRKISVREFDSLSTAQYSANGRVIGGDATLRQLREAGLIDDADRITDAGRAALAGHTPSTFSPSDVADRIAGLGGGPRDPASIVPLLAGLNVPQLKRIASQFSMHVPTSQPGGGHWSAVTQDFVDDGSPSKGKWTAAALAQFIAEGIANAHNNPRFHWRSRDLMDDEYRDDEADDFDDEESEHGPSNVRLGIAKLEDHEGDDEPVDEMDLALEHYKPLDAATRSRALVMRAAGHDVTPGHDELHHYWTRGEGLAKWVGSPKPWTTLVAHLTKYVGPEKAKVFASRWFIEVFGFAAGSDLNRVTHGHPPRGHLVGPG